MKWILFVMLFVTPAKNLTTAEEHDPDPYRQKFESRRIWTLQSTSSMEFSTAKACAAMENAICQSITKRKVATLTLRIWCVCDSGSDSPEQTCPDKNHPPAVLKHPCGTETEKFDKMIQSLTKEKKIQSLTEEKEEKGSFTILRAYPPE